MKNNKVLAAAFITLSLLAVGCEEDETVYGDWIRSSDFEGVSRSDGVAFSINGKGYVCGGYDGKDRLTDLWEYNADQDYWTQKADFPGTARTSATAFALDGKGYVGTGYDGDSYLSDFWEYDPSNNEWNGLTDFGGGERSGAISFGLDGNGYLGTGYNGNFLKDMWKYDPISGSWTQIVSVGGSKRNNATAFVSDGYAYVVCGVNNGSYITDFWRFDPTTGSWSELRAITNESDDDYDDDYAIARAYALPLLIGDRIFITSGESGSLRSDTWEYYPASDTWEETTSFEGTSRSGALTIHTDSRAFILTGRSSTYRFDDMWEFLPDQEYDTDY
ncbi:MAG: kelch repeat-containing protein [Bacteroidales bacterium]|jgi:N-acetylneuraminic acid mutarotase|nr:kelch repeat-containing protein [Bacteroidales bacterium]